MYLPSSWLDVCLACQARMPGPSPFLWRLIGIIRVIGLAERLSHQSSASKKCLIGIHSVWRSVFWGARVCVKNWGCQFPASGHLEYPVSIEGFHSNIYTCCCLCTGNENEIPPLNDSYLSSSLKFLWIQWEVSPITRSQSHYPHTFWILPVSVLIFSRIVMCVIEMLKMNSSTIIPHRKGFWFPLYQYQHFWGLLCIKTELFDVVLCRGERRPWANLQRCGIRLQGRRP